MFSVVKKLPTIEIKKGLFLRLEYLNHPGISGNKFRKLKYNLIRMREEGFKTLLTFGGAYSNHVAAVAHAGNVYGINTVAIIRGDEIKHNYMKNPTLAKATELGMQLKFVSRKLYREKGSQAMRNALKAEFGEFYLLPEGGTNMLAVKGCEEILHEEDSVYDIICCPVGTGGTMAGLINSSMDHQTVLGFPALKGDFLSKEIRKYVNGNNWRMIHDYHFGGYGKINETLISFINRFKTETNIQLDPVYTSKMLFGILDMRLKGLIPEDKKTLAIHTGGLQGIDGMNVLLSKKGLPLLEL